MDSFLEHEEDDDLFTCKLNGAEIHLDAASRRHEVPTHKVRKAEEQDEQSSMYHSFACK